MIGAVKRLNEYLDYLGPFHKVTPTVGKRLPVLLYLSALPVGI
jgi:hypothetical protein